MIRRDDWVVIIVWDSRIVVLIDKYIVSCFCHRFAISSWREKAILAGVGENRAGDASRFVMNASVVKGGKAKQHVPSVGIPRMQEMDLRAVARPKR